MKLAFNLPEINRNETRKAVESALDKYQMYLLMDPEENEPNITSEFKLVPGAPSNQFHSSTEDAAIRKIDQEKKKETYIKKIQKSVNRLSYSERAVMINRYLKDDEIFDYQIYNMLGMSERQYYRIKARAFYKLAFILRIEVYAEGGESA